MDRGAWQAIVYGVAKSDRTEHVMHTYMYACKKHKKEIFYGKQGKGKTEY